MSFLYQNECIFVEESVDGQGLESALWTSSQLALYRVNTYIRVYGIHSLICLPSFGHSCDVANEGNLTKLYKKAGEYCTI